MDEILDLKLFVFRLSLLRFYPPPPLRSSRLSQGDSWLARWQFSVFRSIALAVVTKSATDSVDSNRFYFRSVLYSLKFSVYSVNSV